MSRLAATSMLLLAACTSTPASPPATEIAGTLVYLKTGPKTDLTPEERNTVFGGHFANMSRMARAGELLLAGPFGDERHDAGLRGLFIIDTRDRSKAKAIAETDPGFQAGVFVLEYHDLQTKAPLRTMLAAELAAEDKLAAAGHKPQPGEFGRPYALLIADDGEQARAALADQPYVLLLGKLDKKGAFAILDAKDPAEARSKLGVTATKLGPHVIDGWFATKRLVELPTMARG
jgi:uncharacterized protein YciI